MMAETDRLILERGTVETFEEVVSSNGDDSRVFLTTKGPYRARDGTLLGTFGIARDITARKAQEQELARSEERFRLAQEGARMGTWDIDLVDRRHDLVRRPARRSTASAPTTRPASSTSRCCSTLTTANGSLREFDEPAARRRLRVRVPGSSGPTASCAGFSRDRCTLHGDERRAGPGSSASRSTSPSASSTEEELARSEETLRLAQAAGRPRSLGHGTSRRVELPGRPASTRSSASIRRRRSPATRRSPTTSTRTTAKRRERRGQARLSRPASRTTSVPAASCSRRARSAGC